MKRAPSFVREERGFGNSEKESLERIVLSVFAFAAGDIIIVVEGVVVGGVEGIFLVGRVFGLPEIIGVFRNIFGVGAFVFIGVAGLGAEDFVVFPFFVTAKDRFVGRLLARGDLTFLIRLLRLVCLIETFSNPRRYQTRTDSGAVRRAGFMQALDQTVGSVEKMRSLSILKRHSFPSKEESSGSSDRCRG